MNLLEIKSKACMLTVAALIGGSVVCAVTVICALLVNRGQPMTTDATNSETTATSTPTAAPVSASRIKSAT